MGKQRRRTLKERKKAKEKINWRLDKVKEHCGTVVQCAYVHMRAILTD